MSEQYKEPESVKITPIEEDPSAERVSTNTAANKKSGLVEHEKHSGEAPRSIRQDQFIGTMLNDRYRVVSLIGKGATSAVYKAEDTQSNQLVAIKILYSHLAADTTIVRRFEQEAKTARLLQHPNIVAVRGCEQTSSEIPFLVMDLAEGTSLQDTIKSAGWLPVQQAIDIFVQVCAALSTAHEKGVVHRDLKPSNIMITTTRDGELLVKVLDFGVAKILPATGDTVLKLTQTGEMLGSILYMSPEQCLDKDLDGRSDCYSLGCVMYEALTGKPPLSARTAFETMNKHMTDMPEHLSRVRPDLKWKPELEHIIFKAMAKDPNNRYQKITDLEDDLQKLQTGSTVRVDTSGTPAMSLQLSNDTLLALRGLIREPRSQSSKNLDAASMKYQGQLRPEKFRVSNSITMLAVFSILGGVFMFFLLRILSTGHPGLALILFSAAVAFGTLLILSVALGRGPKTNLQPEALLLGTSPVKVSVSAVEKAPLGSNGRKRFWLYIPPDSHQQLKRLKVEATHDDHSRTTWNSLCTASEAGSEALPVPADVHLNAKGEPVALVVNGAVAQVVDQVSEPKANVAEQSDEKSAEISSDIPVKLLKKPQPARLATTAFICLLLILGFIGVLYGATGVCFFSAAIAFGLWLVVYMLGLFRPRLLPPEHRANRESLTLLSGASSSISVLIIRTLVNSASDQSKRFTIFLMPDAKTQLDWLTLDPVYGDHPTWTAMSNSEQGDKGTPIHLLAEVYLDHQQKPLAVVVQGAIARVVDSSYS
jgi:serine/threonine protein kinase